MGALTVDRLTEPARVLIESRYGMPVAAIQHLATHSNVLYRVDLRDGRRLVLRISQPGSNTRANLELETAWLRTLVADEMLLLSCPLPAVDGQLVVDLAVGHQRRSCVLFTWVPGEPMGEGAGTSGYRAMGRLSALLHRHGGWRPPDPSRLRRWDRTFYYPPELDPVVIDDFRYDHIFEGLRGTLRRGAEISDRVLRRRWSQAEPMVVHGDLHEWNVHLYMGRAWALDFEDIMLALPSQDIAVSLYGARRRGDLDAVLAAFREGYEEYGSWPVSAREELEAYWAARQVMLMNHAAQILPEAEVRDYFGKVLPWLQGYLARQDREGAGG